MGFERVTSSGNTNPHFGQSKVFPKNQGIRIKGKIMALVWHEKDRTAFQTSSVFLTHTLLVQTHKMTIAKEIAEKCRQL